MAGGAYIVAIRRSLWGRLLFQEFDTRSAAEGFRAWALRRGYRVGSVAVVHAAAVGF